jgi:radical SAM superfamily enzyme YgiQ (UPF0313 family)
MAISNGRRLLLSSVCQPFGAKHGDSFGVSADGAHQIMWAQGIFRIFSTTTQWGIDFIAENLEIPATTLHYPSMARFIKEIKRGYDYIGIAFIHATKHKMIPMIKAIRQYSPKSKVILGGYGTAFPDDDLKPYADYICRGEGVEFMRKLLGEPIDNPIHQPTVTSKSYLFSLPFPIEGYIFGGLGCPAGCDFCATSHYFGRKHILFLPTGKTIIDAIERLRKAYPRMRNFYLSDEDFFVNRNRAIQFLEEIRKSDLPAISLRGYGSVKSLSPFSASELVEIGFDLLWIGYEGKRAGYEKMKGRPYKELFDDLRNHGISILASMIIGFDYQTPEIIEEEFQELMSLRPSLCQFLIYGPAYGTPSYHRLKEQGRFLPDMNEPYKYDGFWLGFKHPHINSEEMSKIQLSLYQREFEILGPSIFRIIENQLNGYLALKDHSLLRIREKAKEYRKIARKGLALISASKRYMNPKVNDWLDDLRERIISGTGDINAREHLIAKGVPLLIKLTALKLRHNICTQPRFTKRIYRMQRFS